MITWVPLSEMGWHHWGIWVFVSESIQSDRISMTLSFTSLLINTAYLVFILTCFAIISLRVRCAACAVACTVVSEVMIMSLKQNIHAVCKLAFFYTGFRLANFIVLLNKKKRTEITKWYMIFLYAMEVTRKV